MPRSVDFAHSALWIRCYQRYEKHPDPIAEDIPAAPQDRQETMRSGRLLKDSLVILEWLLGLGYEAAIQLVIVDPLQYALSVSRDVLIAHQLIDAVYDPNNNGE